MQGGYGSGMQGGYGMGMQGGYGMGYPYNTYGNSKSFS